ncbi:MAG: hypothetical protein H7833_06230 [Magnetococcus sp. DMHC-1]
MTRLVRNCVALLLAIGFALRGYTVPLLAEEAYCGIGNFQGKWVDVERGDDRIYVTNKNISVLSGNIKSTVAVQQEKDITKCKLEDVVAGMPQVASLYQSSLVALGSPTKRVCALRVATAGGFLVLLPVEDSLLRLEEARSDPPILQRLSRIEEHTAPHSLPDYGQPPR